MAEYEAARDWERCLSTCRRWLKANDANSANCANCGESVDGANSVHLKGWELCITTPTKQKIGIICTFTDMTQKHSMRD